MGSTEPAARPPDPPHGRERRHHSAAAPTDHSTSARPPPQPQHRHARQLPTVVSVPQTPTCACHTAYPTAA
eukprot:12898295-Prorocentrum_lima.AAC.1